MKIHTLFWPALLLTWMSLWTRIAIQGFEPAILGTAIEWFQQIKPRRLGIGVTKEIVKESVVRDYTKTYIDGEWIQPSGRQVLNVINSTTERSAGDNTLAEITPNAVRA